MFLDEKKFVFLLVRLLAPRHFIKTQHIKWAKCSHHGGLALFMVEEKMGLMGALADGVLAANGKVTGIIPKFLDNVEVGHKGVKDLHIIDSMHERKAMMYDAADAFIVLPGGLGTLDETMEIITWRQLGLHQKPIIIVNLNGYWDSMLTMFQNIIDQGFMHHGHTGHFDQVDDLDGLMDKLDFILKEKMPRHN